MNTLNNFQRVNTTSYIPYTERVYNPNKNENKLSTSYLIENNEKDLLISKQKTRIYQLEQKEKDIDLLNKKYNDLLKDYNNINDYKLKLEYEIKQKDNNYNTDLSLLKNEKDQIQYKYSQSIAGNKKLTSENDYLKKENEIKNKEIERLNKKLNDIQKKLTELTENNTQLINDNKQLNELNENNTNEISKIVEDNCRLSNLCQELHINLNNSEKYKQNLINVIDEKNLSIDNLNNKLNIQEENIKFLNDTINENKIFNENYQRNLKEMNIKIEEYERENENLKEELIKEKNIRIDEENRNKEIHNLLLNKENQIENLSNNYENILIRERELNNENNAIKIDLEKYKNNCKILKEQNNNLMNEIQNIISIHEKVQDKLTRKEKIKNLLDDNKNILQQSLINLDEILNKSIDMKSFV